MTTSIQLRDSIFPGYELAERIGSGGYAEVWRARAPGGIDKAVKIVFGCYDDQLAVQEMKAMERIKGVRHPFVLSLERFEIVDGRLAILTELADMSLEQRAQQCRAQGLPGIAREELLRFISDTAEALDFLAERHGLLHLDIKPANLLILGEHVKVADFGLVKELASRTQNSMVAGLTPTYSSPEMFDDAPSPQSDQYSLAIVYQEMLTGVLPFPGRTAAQLSNQHLRSHPQLAALPKLDQPAVARALAKNPADRFPTCRAFAKALCEAVDQPAKRPPVANKADQQNDSHHDDGSSQPVRTMPRAANGAPPARSSLSGANFTQPTVAHSHCASDTKADIKSATNVWPKEEIVDVAFPDVDAASVAMPPTLYVAVGGVGIRILCRLRDLLAHHASHSPPSPAVEMIAIDTDRAELKDACSSKWNDPLPATDALHLSLKLPQEYRKQGSGNLEWLSHRWLYNIPRSLETRGYRPLGRLALVDHLEKALALIDRKLNRLASSGPENAEHPSPTEIRVVLLMGMGGGTGGGMAIDLANAARSRLQALERKARIQGVFVCGCLGNAHASPLSVTNTYALLSELRFVTAFGNQGTQGEATGLQRLESRARPFDLVYCVSSKRQSDDTADDGLEMIARQLSLAAIEGVRQTLHRFQQSATPREQPGHEPLLLRTFCSATLSRPMQNRIHRLAGYLQHAIERHWLANASPGEWQWLSRTSDDEGSLKSPADPHDAAEISKIATGSSPTRAEEWCRGFGDYAATRFTYEVVSRICCQSVLRDNCRTISLSSRDPAKFAELAAQTIFSLGKRAAATTWLDDPLSDEDEAIVNKLVLSGDRVLAKIIEELEQITADTPFETAQIGRVIAAECASALQIHLGRSTTEGAVAPNPASQDATWQALDRATVDLLQCGYDRRTLILLPPSNQPTEAIEALIQARPSAAVLTAEVSEAVVFCEGSGVSSSALSRGFERVYPDIAEAARRLFTRIDIDWML